MQKILVTGATGLLGSQLLLDLLESSAELRCLRRGSSNLTHLNLLFKEKGKEDLLNHMEWFEGDVNDIFSLRDAMKDITHVYHCAAIVSFSPDDDERMMHVNIEGTANVVNEALEAGVKKFCHVSSIAALGRSVSGEVLTEDSTWTNSPDNTAYAISKYCSEREVWRGIAEGMDAVIVNPSVIIGPGNWKASSAMLFPMLAKGFKFYTEGVNGFVDVRDVSASMIRLMNSDVKNERFIISSESVSYKSVFEIIANTLGQSVPSIKVTPLLSAIVWRLERVRQLLTGSVPLITRETARTASGKYFYSNEKIKKTTGIKFIPIKDSLEQTGRFFLKTHP